MPVEHLATRRDIEDWANRIESRADFPELIRRLILSTSAPRNIDFPAQEGVGMPGWDGLVENEAVTTYVPDGSSGWEVGTGADPGGKANDDYSTRTRDSLQLDAAQSAFVFCTPRAWAGKRDWIAARQGEGIWREVRAYDVDDLMTWLALAPAVHIWLSNKLGKPIEQVQDIQSWWETWRAVTDPPISSELLLSGRSAAAQLLLDQLSSAPKVINVQGETAMEALAFVASAITLQNAEMSDALISRTVVVDRPEVWRRLAAQERPLILIPRFHDSALFSEAERSGHHVVATVGTHYRLPVDIQLPRISAREAIEVLEREGLPSVQARHMAGLVRRSLSAYRRVLAESTADLPEWAQSEHARQLIPLILAGAWDEAVVGDREVIEQLTARSYEVAGW